MRLNQRQRRFLYGGAASVVAHVLAALLLWRARASAPPLPLPPPAPKAPAIEIALREWTPPKPPSGAVSPKTAQVAPKRVEAPKPIEPAAPKIIAPKPAPVVPPRPAREAEQEAKAARPTPAETPAKPAESPKPSSGTAQAGGPAAPGDPGLERWSTEWRSKEGLAVPEGPSRRGGGLATALPGDQVGPALGIGPAQPDELPRAEAIGPERDEVVRKRIAGRIDGFAQSFNAHERAVVPDVYWRNLRDAMAKNFDVPYEVLGQGGGGSGPGPMAALAKQYGKDLDAYGKSGNPFAGEANAPGAPFNLQQDVAHQQLAGRGLSEIALGQVEMLQRGLKAATSQHLVARILISQNEDGTLADVALVDGSGNKVYDRLALQQAKSMVKKKLELLGPLPPVGRRTLWAFDTDFSVMPPLPIAGCGIDAYFIPRECYYPLKKTARTRINLEAIY